MTPLAWFGYLTATTSALALGGVLFVIVYMLYHAARGWIAGGADSAVGAADNRGTE